MGVVMGVPLAHLEIIRVSSDIKSVQDREIAMFKVWIEEKTLLPKTWQVLVDAVEHEAGGHYRGLAMEISEKIAKYLLG